MAYNNYVEATRSIAASFLRKLIIGVVVLIVLTIVATFISTQVPYSEGDRAGVVSKFSTKGVMFKTNEGELNVGAQGQVGNMVNNTWAFTVSDDYPDVSQKLKDALLSGKRVRLHYEQPYLKFWWMGDTEYFVTQVDFAQ